VETITIFPFNVDEAFNKASLAALLASLSAVNKKRAGMLSPKIL